MSDSEPVIELTPKNPFSWKVIILFVIAWLVVLGLVVEMKSGTLRLLLPAIAVLFVVYLTVCTIILLKRKK